MRAVWLPRRCSDDPSELDAHLPPPIDRLPPAPPVRPFHQRPKRAPLWRSVRTVVVMALLSCAALVALAPQSAATAVAEVSR